MEEFKKCCTGKTFPTVVAVFLVSAIVFTLVSSWAKVKQVSLSEDRISFSGKGEIVAKPDLAIIDFSVVIEKSSIADAMSANTETMNAVNIAMKKAGVDSKDLKTTNFSIYPRYEYPRSTTDIYPSNKRVLVGYEISQTLQVKIRDIGNIGAILQAGTDAGANQVGDLQLTIENQDELKNQAREIAIKDAKDKARDLSKQLGVRLAKITGFSESGQDPWIYPVSIKEMDGVGGGSPQIETGQNKITINVTITYQIGK